MVSALAGSDLRRASSAADRFQQRRYLRYDETNPEWAGMNHQLAKLERMLCEAHASGRLAVLPELRLLRHHNGFVVNDWSWDTYFDLALSRLVDHTGAERPLPIVRGSPPAGVSTLTLAPRRRRPAAAEDCALLVRHIKDRWNPTSVPVEDRPPLLFRWHRSKRVRELAGPVVSDLRARGEGRFVAVHARRGDRHDYPRRRTAPAAIRDHLVEHGIPDGTTLFLLSDERDRAFWAPLEEHYDLARYADYARLAALISPAGGRRPDNYLLFEVEKEVMAGAWWRVETLPGHCPTDPHSWLVDEPTWRLFRAYRVVRWTGRRLMRNGRALPGVPGGGGQCRRAWRVWRAGE